MRLYIQHGPKLIYNQLGCLYRHFGANSDEAACFLICTSLISQQSPPRSFSRRLVLLPEAVKRVLQSVEDDFVSKVKQFLHAEFKST
jgi:hypothetical protein